MRMENIQSSISIVGYTDYRKFLKDAYEDLKLKKHFFSYRYFAQKAGLSSPGLLKMVIASQRNLTPKTMEQFIKGFGLKGSEAQYFRTLVVYNQAKKDADRVKHFTKLRKLMERRKVNSLSLQQYDFFSNWYIPVIREIINCDDFKNDSEKISEYMYHEVSPQQVEEAIKVLLNLALVGQDKRGNLASKPGHLKTDDSISHLGLKNYHRGQLDQAKKSIERTEPQRREIQALTIGIDPEKIEQAKEKILEFMDDMRDMLHSGSNKQVYQLNVQFFNLTKEDFSA
jgi:uncharacterized protein (TIGR02147 family)